MGTRSTAVMRIVYAVIAVVIAVGFVIQFWLLFTGGSDANSGESGSTIPLLTRFVRLFSFFTIGSNLLVLIAAIVSALGRGRGTAWQAFYFAALLSIAVTGTAFSFLLDPSLTLKGPAQLVTNLFHIVSPILFVLTWLLWGPRRRFGWRAALLSFIWPVAWLVYTFVHGAITGWYPYLILDVGKVGVGGVIGGSAIVLAFALVLTLILLAIDRWAPALPTVSSLPASAAGASAAGGTPSGAATRR